MARQLHFTTHQNSLQRSIGLPIDELETSRRDRRLTVAMKSTGTYGDALRHQFKESCVEIYQIGAKRVPDAREVYNDVQNIFDAKVVLTKDFLSFWPALHKPRKNAFISILLRMVT